MAISRLWLSAALAVIAISGRLVAIERRMSPPRACPSPERDASISVVLESAVPATQTATAAMAKIASRRGRDSVLNRASPRSVSVARRDVHELYPAPDGCAQSVHHCDHVVPIQSGSPLGPRCD